jgi:N-acetylgalactosamine-N,N'-diacetylbacillosaminyl-diphospho-undecaprenol 4-alpha-N-acetylgalactosaminyltransferase
MVLKKIGVLINSLEGGGAERVVSLLINELNSKNIEIFLFLINDKRYYKINSKIRVFSLSNKKQTNITLGIFSLAYDYSKLLKKNCIELSISFLTKSNYINILSSVFYTKKTIISERGFPSLVYEGYSIKNLINRVLIKTIYRKSDLIIANSKGNYNDLLENFKVPKHKLRLIHNPINFKLISNYKPIENFFDINYTNLISVGTLNDNKNFSFQINAIKKLNDNKIRLYIFGDGPNMLKLKKLIIELKLQNQVFLSGKVSNIFSYLKSADAFIFSSLSEGFPNVILEAISCKLPVISTNCLSGPDEILFNKIIFLKENKEADLGILCPYDNLDKFVEAIEGFCLNKIYWKNKISKKFRSRIKDFDLKVITNQFLKEFN